MELICFRIGGSNCGLASFYPRVTIVRGKNGLPHFLFQDKKEKHHHHHHHHHHRHHKKSTSEDVAGPSSDLLVATGSTESPNAEQYSMLLQTSASASDVSSAANGPAVNILYICHSEHSIHIMVLRLLMFGYWNILGPGTLLAPQRPCRHCDICHCIT